MRFTAPLTIVSVQALASLFLPTLVVGCDQTLAETEQGPGELTLPLTTRSPSGHRYRLDADFDVSGSDSMLLNAQDDQEMLSQELHVGSYLITLRPAWQLMRADAMGTWEAVDAELRSTETRAFDIAPNAVTRVAYGFLADGEEVTFETGTLELAVEVEEGTVAEPEPEPACDDGVHNGDESDTDCGGSCRGCSAGSACNIGGDCATASCALGTCGTLVSAGVLAADTTWTAAASPYVLAGTLQVGGALTVAAGAHVIGHGQTIEVHGRLEVAGTPDELVRLDQVYIAQRGPVAEPFTIEIGHARFEGGSPYAPGNHGGSFNVHDCVMIGTQRWYVHYPDANSFIERNVFVNSGGISVGTYGVPVTIINNYFVGQITDFAVESWASYRGTFVSVHRNTFASTDRTALSLPPAYDSAAIDGTENYWGTTDVQQIANMIRDRNDDLNAARTIPFEPFLTEPDPATPTP